MSPRIGSYRELKKSWRERNRRVWRFLNWWEKREAEGLGSPLYKAANGLGVAIDLILKLHPEIADDLDQMEEVWK